jgi:hypothetical protein
VSGFDDNRSFNAARRASERNNGENGSFFDDLRSGGRTDEFQLVHRLLNPFGLVNPFGLATGRLAVFQGASEAPIPPHFDTGGRKPDLQERKMVRDAPSNAIPARTALPAAHFERNEAQGI